MVCIYTEKKNPILFFFFFEKMFLVCKTLNFFHPGMLCATFGCIWPSGPRVILEKSSMQFCYFVIIPQGKGQLTLHLNKLRKNNLTVTRLRSVTVKPGEHMNVLHDLSAKGLGTSSEKLRKPSPVQHNYLPN